MRGGKNDQRENRVEERKMVEVEERKPVKERLGKICGHGNHRKSKKGRRK